MLQKNNNEIIKPTETQKLNLYNFLKNVAEKTGHHLNPDYDFAMDLIDGLLINKQRYGYMCCPCRLASGDVNADKDIICPCKYRDEDLAEYNTCFCSLYVTEKVINNEVKAKSIPERRN